MTKATALKKRYISCELRSESAWGEDELKKAIYDEAMKFFGEYLSSYAALKFVSYDSAKHQVLLRCNRDLYPETLGFLALVSFLNRKPARLVALATSGTIKGIGRRLAGSAQKPA